MSELPALYLRIFKIDSLIFHKFTSNFALFKEKRSPRKMNSFCKRSCNNKEPFGLNERLSKHFLFKSNDKMTAGKTGSVGDIFTVSAISEA